MEQEGEAEEVRIADGQGLAALTGESEEQARADGYDWENSQGDPV